MAKIEIEHIKNKIKEKKANWRASENRISKMEEHNRRKLLGAVKPINSKGPAMPEIGSEPINYEIETIFDMDLIESVEYSASVDWRISGNVTPVKDQGNCGSCVSFAAVSVTESMLSIERSINDNLSEADLHFCSSHGANCDGWWPLSAFNEIKSRGCCKESCFPYTINPTCNVCGNRDDNLIKITNISSFSNVNLAKDYISSVGPVTGVFAVYTDFFNYSSGVYKNVTGTFEGLHCISIIGYSETSKYWICKNSWGDDWGDNGYFKIAYGNCLIDSYDKIGVSGIILSSEFTTTTLSSETTTLSPNTTTTLSPNTTTSSPSTSTTTKKITTSTTTKQINTTTTTKFRTTTTTTKMLKRIRRNRSKQNVNFYLKMKS